MSIACPHCGHQFELKARPGVYQPACPDCRAAFALVVPRDAGQAPVAAKTLDELKARQSAHTAHAAPPRHASPETHAPEKTPTEAATVMETESPTLAGDEPATRVDPSHDAGGSTQAEGSDGKPLGVLEGYVLIKELGRGGMGCVYLARQVSLDREVAVKTIHPAVADDPAFLARFVREAFAVAQLSHHNVVQIHDVGQHEDTHFFSMELVPGRSLAEVVQQNGPLDPRTAAMYILHAARGLAYAHEHRMVHRDVKPANLLLSDSGMVKVADLGLVKTDHSLDEAAARSGALSGRRQSGDTAASANDTTPQQTASMLGTPAYMAPEQADDAAKVDARADIYALGGTLYYLVTGKPPYSGKTAKEIIRNHRKQPLVPPTQINPRIPATLSAFIEKLLAKDPAQRPRTMAKVIKTLEQTLSIPSGPFTPRPEHTQAVESASNQLRQITPAKVRRGLIIAFHAGVALMLILGILASNLGIVSSAAVVWVVTILTYQITLGLFTRNELFRRCRRFAMTVGWLQWFIALGGVISFSVMMVAIGLQWAYLGALIGGVVLGVGFYLGIERWVARQRSRVLLPIQNMLTELRQHGVEEQAVRQFVCRHAGRHWEQLYELLFGYDEKLEARRLWGYDHQGNPRPRFRGYRDSIITALDRMEQERIDEHRKHHLQRVEVRRLRAEGMDDMKALAEARQLARNFDDNTARYRATKSPRSLAEAYHNKKFTKGVSDQSLESIPESWRLQPTPWTTLLAYWFFAARGRFLVGSVILLGWMLWATKREALPTLPESGSYLEHFRSFLAYRPAPLNLPGVPPALLDVVSTPGAMFAGLLLMVSAMFQGVRMTIFLIPIVIMLLRAPYMPTYHGEWMSQMEWTFLIAFALIPPGLFFGRSRD